MKDIIERLECVAEKTYDEMLQSDGRLKCYCGKLFNPEEEGGTVSLNPYDMPICGNCFEEWFTEMEGRNERNN